jgi:hypothetical protein
MKRTVILILIFIFLLINFCLADDWKELRSIHFIIYYKETSRDFLYKLRNFAEDYYQDILEDLGFRRSEFWTWENRAKIYVFDSGQDYIQSTNMTPWSGASVDYYNKIINTYPDAPDFFENILVHELTHIIFREYVGFGSNVPLWLDEGVATFMEKKKKVYLLKRQLRQLNKTNSLSSFKELTQINKVTTFSKERAGEFYIQSLSLVYFLINKFGKDYFAKFCYALRQGRSLERSLSFAYNIRNLDDLESKWRSYFFD